MNWAWMFWQVAVPVGGPIALSALFILLWWTGAEDFSPQWGLIIDVSPWALTFYALTLIGTTLHGFWPKLSDHKGLGFGLIGTALAVCVYAAFIAIWRHHESFAPSGGVYWVTGALLVVSIVLCYQAHTRYENGI